LSQLADFFSQTLPHYDEVIFTGDFNLRLLSEPRVCEQLNDLLMSFSLFQHVNQPTHERGDILDLVITRTASTILSSISLTPVGDLTKHKKLASSIHKHDLLFTPYFKKPN
jgi:hypothetical protein